MCLFDFLKIFICVGFLLFVFWWVFLFVLVWFFVLFLGGFFVCFFFFGLFLGVVFFFGWLFVFVLFCFLVRVLHSICQRISFSCWLVGSDCVCIKCRSPCIFCLENVFGFHFKRQRNYRCLVSSQGNTRVSCTRYRPGRNHR